MSYKIFLILIWLFCVKSSFSQKEKPLKDILDLVNSDDYLISHSLNNSLCLIKQEYVLTNKKGEDYGRKSDPFFGKKYAIGVITDSGIVTVINIQTPWSTDVNYQRYKKVDSLQPRLSKTFIKRFSNNTFVRVKDRKYKNLDQNTTLLQIVNDSLPKIPFQNFGVESMGWLVLGYLDEGQNANDTAKFTLSVVKPVFEPVDANGRMYIKNLVLREKIIGGAFFSAKITIGRVSFAVAGIVQQDNKGYYITANQIKTKEDKETPQPLNPINNPATDEPQKIINPDGID